MANQNSDVPKKIGRPKKQPEVVDNYDKKTSLLSPQELVKVLYNNRDVYIPNILYIRNKDSEIVPLIPNFGQKKVLKVIREWEEKYPNPKNRPTLFVIILKARQIGFSTIIEAVMFHRVQFERDRNAMVVSYDDRSSTSINSMAELFYEKLPLYIKPKYRPSRGNGLILENPAFNPGAEADPRKNDPGLRSKMMIATAANVNAGSSFTLHYLHLSELAKWPGDPSKTLTSLLQAVPKNGGMVFIESTAMGYNLFQELWEKAENGENDYIPIFVPWWEHDEYCDELTPEEKKWETQAKNAISRGEDPDEYHAKMGLTETEESLMERFDLTYGQIKWRRWAIDNKCLGDEKVFQQEYPSSPEEAFLSTGTPVFDNLKLRERKEKVEKKHRWRGTPLRRGRIIYDLDLYGDYVAGSCGFELDRNGELNVYVEPILGRPYVIGIDSAEGGIDNSVLQVIDNSTGEQVATWAGHTEADILARIAIALGYYYNTALLAFEVNFDTHPVRECVRMRYPKLYMREDFVKGEIKSVYGFKTTQLTRPIIIGDLVKIVRDYAYWINDVETINEMTTFIRNEKGRPEAAQGKKDDRVMALAIAYSARNQQTTFIKVTQKTKIGGRKVPADILHDYRKAPKDQKQRLARKWGLV